MTQLRAVREIQASVGGPVYVLKVKAACPQCGGLRDAELMMGTSRGNSVDEPGSILRLQVASVSACESCARPRGRGT